MSADFFQSLAFRQVAVGGPVAEFPLFPPLLEGVREETDPSFPYPLEVDFRYGEVDKAMFGRRPAGRALGLAAWAPLMPPLTEETNLGEGDTPLLERPELAAWAGVDRRVFIKDEGRNPTWSHKDRLNRCTVSAAQICDAPGIIVASSGNHGASASAYAAAAGLPCIVIATSTAPLAMQRFVLAYGAAALSVPTALRWNLLSQLADITGFQPVSNRTPEAHTGHAFASEGYKSIAYEIHRDLGGEVPGTVFVPTGYGELLYGVWKGFRELRDLGLIDRCPQMFACEPSAYAPHHRAFRDEKPVVAIATPNHETLARSIATPVGGLRGRTAIEESGGGALALGETDIEEARLRLAMSGLWVEVSAAAGLAGLRQQAARRQLAAGPVVCISTSSGMKDVDVKDATLPETTGTLADARRVLSSQYGLEI